MKAFAAAAACLLLAAAPAPPTAEVVPAAQLRATVAKTTDGLVFHPAFADPAAKTVIVRRDGPGEVEVNTLLNDVLIAQAGSATLLVGGRLEGGRETAASIPGAKLLMIEGMGHATPIPIWPQIIGAIADHAHGVKA